MNLISYSKTGLNALAGINSFAGFNTFVGAINMTIQIELTKIMLFRLGSTMIK